MRRFLLFLFSHRFLAIARWELHFMLVRLSNTVQLRFVTIRRTLAARGRPLFLNLGSGPRGLDEQRWVNVDGFMDKNVHFVLDISRRLPFPDECFDGVFCEHVLEHFSLEDGQRLATEVRRILAPGGRFRVIVPDAELIIRQYTDAPEALIAYRGDGETAMEAVNSFFRQRHEHQFLYDALTIERMLLRAGFRSVTRSECGRSDVSELALDDPKYKLESLYVEGVR